eukprot:51850-Hanusia_phi.AAC.1
MLQTKCLNVNFNTTEPGVVQNLIDPVVSLCDAAGTCRSINVCNPAAAYDERTGQSCDLLHASVDDNCTTQFLHLSSYLGGQSIVMQEHCKEVLFVRDLYVNSSLPVRDIARLDLDTANPAGSICLRTDSTCFQDQGLLGASIDVATVQSVQGVDVYAFYRPLAGGGGDPNSNLFYGPLYQKGSTAWYPPWVDCYNVNGLNKSRLLDWTGWYPARVAAVKNALLQNNAGKPDLSVLDKEAIWSDVTHRPSGLSERCNRTSCVSSTGVARPCPAGVCNVTLAGSGVHAVALVLHNRTELFCASGVAAALSLCPGRPTNDSVLVMVRNNLWYCKSDCQRVLKIKYIGRHLFKYRFLTESVLGFTASDRISIGLSPTSSAALGYSQKDAFRLVHYLVSRQVLGSGNALPSAMYSTFWTPPSTVSQNFMAANARYPWSVLTLYDYTNYKAQAASMRSQPLSSCINQPVSVPSCTNTHVDTLATCVQNLKRPSAPIANPLESVLTRMAGSQVTSSYLMHWAASSRPSRDTYIDWLLSPLRCQQTLQSEAICYQTIDQRVFTINPWLADGFNIYEACDTAQLVNQPTVLISGGCHPQGSGTCNNFTRLINPNCITRNRQPPRQIDILTSASNNLCTKAPRTNATCLLRQGLFGGGTGNPVVDLYRRPATITAPSYSGIFGKDPNPSYHSRTPSNGVLGQSLMDIGGGLFVADLKTLSGGTVDNLLPACMPLFSPRMADGSPNLYGRDACANNQTVSWLSSYLVDSRADYSLNQADLGGTSVNGQVGWDCPVKEMHFWSGLDPNFRPKAPYGPRAGVMFAEASNMGGTVGNGMSNPMQVYGQVIGSLYPAVFASEVCSCSSGADCSFQASSTSGGCSILKTVDFLTGSGWYAKQSYSGSYGCKQSLDWPHAGGTLRDGTALGYSSSGNCPAHDRLRQFELRYIPVAVTATAGQTTIDPGGECHMGTLVTVPSSVPFGGQCRRFNYSHLQCSVTTPSGVNLASITQVSYHALDVPRSTPYAQQVANPANYKRRCNLCDRPPYTQYFVDRTNQRVSGVGYVNKNFTSFGVPVRLSLARMMARDIRQQICGNQASCPLLDQVANQAEWTIDRFMTDYLQDAARLLTTGGTATTLVPALPAPVDDSAFWGRNWSYCTDTTRNQTTGKYNKQCFGSVPKAEWVDPTRRMGSCKAAILDNTPTAAAMIPIRICTLDAAMNDLCVRVADFLQRIEAANCKAAGVCVQTEFLYNPASYSISNQEFVTQTVLNFYESVIHRRGDRRRGGTEQQDEAAVPGGVAGARADHDLGAAHHRADPGEARVLRRHGGDEPAEAAGGPERERGHGVRDAVGEHVHQRVQGAVRPDWQPDLRDHPGHTVRQPAH